MGGDMYKQVKQRVPKEKRHVSLPLIVGVAALTLALIAVLIVWPVLAYRRYTAFLNSLSADTVFAAEHDCLRCERDGQPPLRLTVENAYAVYNKLVVSGQGAVGGEIPESGGVRLDYGNGASLELWPKTFSGHGRREGLMIRYIDKEGTAFIYTTNRTAYSYFSVLFQPSDNPLWEE